MQITRGKILSLIVAVAYLLIIFFDEGAFTKNMFKGSAALLLPLALIWFPTQLGSFTGYVGRGGDINTETPAIMISAAGWFFLIGIPVIIYLLNK